MGQRFNLSFSEALFSVVRFAGLGFLGRVIPGLRSLCSLTRGYNLPPLRGSLIVNLKLVLR